MSARRLSVSKQSLQTIPIISVLPRSKQGIRPNDHISLYDLLLIACSRNEVLLT